MPINNADTGVLLSWEADSDCQYCGYSGQSPPSSTLFGLATTSASGVSSTTVNIPGQAGPIVPALQAQDGTFFGSVGTGPSPGSVTQTSMIRFDASSASGELRPD